MNTIVSAEALRLPRSWRKRTGIQEKDKLNIALSDGLIVLQKIQQISEKEIQALVEQSRRLPPLTPAREEEIENAIQEARREKRKQ